MAPEPRDLSGVVDRIVEQRYSAALDTVARLREEHPEDTPDELCARVIRQCARDLAIGGAMSGGAAASPVAGLGMAAAAVGADTTYGVSRLGEMVMAIGIVNGFDDASAKERATWVAAVLGASEGAAIGLTGVAAKVGARGGTRLLARIPTRAVAGASRTSRVAGNMMSKRGPWSLAALIPYGIGAGVGAAGNAALAWSVGRAAKSYFATHADAPSSGGRSPGGPGTTRDAATDDIWEAEVVEERIVDD